MNTLNSVKQRLDTMSSEFSDYNQCMFTKKFREDTYYLLVKYWLTPFLIDFDNYEYYYEEDDRRETDIDEFMIDLRKDLLDACFDPTRIDMFLVELSDYIYSITSI